MFQKAITNRGPLLALSVTAFSIVVARAYLQSISIDEAGSYLIFARESWPAQWFPSSGNHVLNTILMRLVTTIVPFNEFTIRIPAILGATIYIVSTGYLWSLLTRRKLLQFTLFICMVFNPFILDYLVAARGYSLAIGFLTAALAIFADAVLTGTPGAKGQQVSILLALSFAANFSFGIVNGTVLLILFLWMRRPLGTRKAMICCFFPGFLVAFVLVGSVVWTFPKNQLYFGSNSLAEMWAGLRDASFDQPNPEVVNPILMQWLSAIRGPLPYIVALTSVAVIVTIEVCQLRSGSEDRDPLLTETRILVGITLLSLLVHWIALRTVHLLLPRERTGLFFVVLWTLSFGSAVTLLDRVPGPSLLRVVALGVTLLVAIYFVGCLRFGYFREWKFDSDTKKIYWLVSDLRQRCGITDFVTDWRYEGALNFYRRSYSNDLLPEFHGSTSGELPRGHNAYVIFYPTSIDVIKEEHLNVLYHSGDSEVAIAIRSCPGANREIR